MNNRTPALALALCAALAHLAAAQGNPVEVAAARPSPDETARFLAGLDPGRGTVSALSHLAALPAWRGHSNELHRAWARLDKATLQPMRAFSATELGDWGGKPPTLLYMFSGPDILYALTVFPFAPRFVLCGLEPVGEVPDPTTIPPDRALLGLDGLRKALETSLNFSFFKTIDMKVDLKNNTFAGTIPIMLAMIAKSGREVVAIDPVRLDDSGTPTLATWPSKGVRIVFRPPGGKPQELFYFSTDISNDGIKKTPGFAKFARAQAPAAGYLKAASYLLHEEYFSKVRDLLLECCPAIVQDDSGIPFRAFHPAEWDARLYGTYSGPIELFANKRQPDLAQAYSQGARALPFGTGYRWRRGDSNLLVAFRRESRPAEVVQPAPQPPIRPRQ